MGPPTRRGRLKLLRGSEKPAAMMQADVRSVCVRWLHVIRN